MKRCSPFSLYILPCTVNCPGGRNIHYRVYKFGSTPVLSPSITSFLFARDRIHFIKLQSVISRIENTINKTIAFEYRGESLALKKYGLQIFPNCPERLMVAIAHAFFCAVSLIVLAAQLNTTGLAQKTPVTKRNDATYRAGMPNVATLMMKPMIATMTGTMMWNPRSFRRSLDHANP